MSDDSRIPAIPTVYRGVRYRSRLEARWAAVFDALALAHEYEPIDLRRYIPDFVVQSEAGALLVECKPILVHASDEYAEHHAKIRRSGWQGDAVIVGAALHAIDGGIVVGRMRHAHDWSTCYVRHVSDVWSFSPEPERLDLHERVALRMAWANAGNAVQWCAP